MEDSNASNGASERDVYRLIDGYIRESLENFRSNPHEASRLAEKASQLALEIQYDEGAALASLASAWSGLFLARMDRAEKYGIEALAFFTDRDDKPNQAMALLALGGIARERGGLDQAWEYCMKAIEISKAAGRKDLEGMALNYLGEVIRNSGEIREGLGYFLEAAEAIGSVKQDGNNLIQANEVEASIFINMGEAFIAIGEIDAALGYLELARSFAEQATDASLLAELYKHSAFIARRDARPEEAKEFLRKAFEASKNTGQILTLKAVELAQVELYLDEKKYEEAVNLLDLTIRDCEEYGLVPKLSMGLKLRSLAHEALGHFSQALADYKQYHRILENSSASEAAKKSRIARIQFEVEQARQEAELHRRRNKELAEHQSRLEKTNNMLEAVMEIGKVVISSLDIETVAWTANENLSKLMVANEFCLALKNERQTTIEFVLVLRDGKRMASFSIPLEDENSYASWVIRNEKAVKLNNVKREYKQYVKNHTSISGKKIGSVLYCPLIMNGKVMGAMGLASATGDAYTDEDVRFISSLGTFIAVAIGNSRNHAELLWLNKELKNEKAALEKLTNEMTMIANHDSLTGLPNRLLLDELFSKTVLQARRHKRYFGVLFLDMDNFKPINDTYGHHIGDEALIEVSKRLKNTLRSSDIIARIGGDEFIAIVEDLENTESAAVIAQKLIYTLTQPMNLAGNNCALGVSIGIAMYPGDGESSRDLYRHADEAMYSVKKKGKNGYSFTASVTENNPGNAWE
jgi:diguanylate cyclase (GGDEF)-like protein